MFAASIDMLCSLKGPYERLVNGGTYSPTAWEGESGM